MRINPSPYIRSFLAILPGLILFVVIEAITTDKNTAHYSFLVVAPVSLAGFPWSMGAVGLATTIEDQLSPAIVDIVAAIVLFFCVFINAYLIARTSPMPIATLVLFSVFLALPLGMFLSNG